MTNEAIEAAARAIAEALGDSYDHAFISKSYWIAERGESGGRFRDVNEPYQYDYIEAARAAAPALMEEGARLALEAAKRDHIDWYRLLKRIRKEHGSGMSDIAHGIVATFDALDPAAIVKGAGHDRD